MINTLVQRWRRRGLMFLGLVALVVLAAATAALLVDARSLDAGLKRSFGTSSKLSLLSYETPRLTFFPWPRIRIANAVLETPEGEDGLRTRIEAKQIRARLNLYALAMGNGAITEMSLFEPSIALSNTEGADRLTSTVQALARVMDSPGSQALRRLSIENGVLTVDGTQLLGNLNLAVNSQASFGRDLSGTARYGNIDFRLKATLDRGTPAATTWSLSSDNFAVSFAGSRLGAAGLDTEGWMSLFWTDGGRVARQFGLEDALTSALDSVAIDGQARVLWPALLLRGATVKLNNATFKGAIEASFATSVPRLSATLATEHIVLPAFSATSSTSGKQEFLNDTTQQLKTLRGNADIRLSAGLVSIGKLPLGESAVSLSIRPDRMEAVLTQGTNEGGQIKARAQFAFQDGQLRGRTSLTAERLPGDVVAALSGLPLARGSISASLVHDGVGADLRSLLKTGSGNGSASLTNGEIKGVDLQRLFSRSERNQTDTSLPTGTTRIQSGSAKLRLFEGRLQFDEGLLRNPLLRAPFEGSVDLLNDTIDMTVRLQTPFDISRFGEARVMLTGPLMRPNFKHEWRPAPGRT
jgi:AsmA protein